MRPERVELIGLDSRTDEDYAVVLCPECKQRGIIDADQYFGRISMLCMQPGCTYHEVHDLSEESP